ncbi:MAG: transketolase [Clostridia bacterium]|nr:transketolase [Clostridia bacterium]
MNSSELLTINCMRILSAEAIEKAKSGHPGITMGAAPMAYELWAKHMKHNPHNPKWINRDRFVLSAGHGSMMLYSLLHLFGYGLTIDDLKNFRQFGSVTPGHPEFNHTPGVDASTGPLGQGFANAVGMAMAEAHLAAKFNRDDFNVIDHYSYALCGDGCMMEGISYEAASLAGTLGLGKLIVLYDSNNITIEGSTDLAFTEDVRARFEALEWQTLFVEDGTDIDAIGKAIEEAKAEKNKPTLIEIKTVIGHGSPNKAGSNSSHGAPLGEEEVRATKANLGWNYEEDFFVPEQVKEHMEAVIENLESEADKWDDLYENYKEKYPELAAELEEWLKDEFAQDLIDDDSFWLNEGDMATRACSEKILNMLSKKMPNLFGGSADLSPSNKSEMKDREFFTKENRLGSNMHFGIRELAMAAVANGMYYHGGIRPYIASFFVFSDYMKPALRVSAISGLPVISILTHDSIGVGEDGPTHQPVEQIAAYRSTPNFNVWRPCDINESAAAWYSAATEKTTPTALLFTRQNTKNLGIDGRKALKGGYVVRESFKETPDVILIGTGSETGLVYDAYDVLKEKGISAQVVSMPCVEVFEKQNEEYKNSVLPKNVKKRIVVEASFDMSWYRYVGLEGEIIGMNEFGKSAPYSVLFDHYGFTVDNVVERTLKLLEK